MPKSPKLRYLPNNPREAVVIVARELDASLTKIDHLEKQVSDMIDIIAGQNVHLCKLVDLLQVPSLKSLEG